MYILPTRYGQVTLVPGTPRLANSFFPGFSPSLKEQNVTCDSLSLLSVVFFLFMISHENSWTFTGVGLFFDNNS